MARPARVAVLPANHSLQPASGPTLICQSRGDWLLEHTALSNSDISVLDSTCSPPTCENANPPLPLPMGMATTQPPQQLMSSKPRTATWGDVQVWRATGGELFHAASTWAESGQAPCGPTTMLMLS